LYKNWYGGIRIYSSPNWDVDESKVVHPLDLGMRMRLKFYYGDGIRMNFYYGDGDGDEIMIRDDNVAGNGYTYHNLILIPSP